MSSNNKHSVYSTTHYRMFKENSKHEAFLHFSPIFVNFSCRISHLRKRLCFVWIFNEAIRDWIWVLHHDIMKA